MIKGKVIENIIPYDAFISSIDGLINEVSNVNLEVYFTSKKIYESEDSVFVFLNMYDNSGNINALLIGDRNKECISLIDNIKYGLKYRINGNVSILKKELIDVELPFIENIKNHKIFYIHALQCYSDTIYGMDIKEFNACTDIKHEYDVVSKYTDYLKNINLEQVKDIKVIFDEIMILLKDGTLLVNGEKKLNNIDRIHYLDSYTICAISKDNVINILSKKSVSDSEFINNNNYSYKKVLVTEFGVVALRYEGVVVYFGYLGTSVIDYTRFVNITDIILEDDTGEVIVIKEGKQYSLFHNVESNI